MLFVGMKQVELVTLVCKGKLEALWKHFPQWAFFAPLSSDWDVKWHVKSKDKNFEPLTVDAVQYSGFLLVISKLQPVSSLF